MTLDDHGNDLSRVTQADLDAIGRQLGRPARAAVEIAARCPCGCPAVVRTAPRLPGGTPFPTSYYATCPRLTGAISTLESEGVMARMSERLLADDELAQAYRRAHESYLADRAELGAVPEIDGISAGGMPTRVKCLHVLVAHSLAKGPGVNPLGDEALAMLPNWWEHDRCCEGSPGGDGGAPADTDMDIDKATAATDTETVTHDVRSGGRPE